MSAVPYGPAVQPEPGEEYLRIAINELAPRAPRRKPPAKKAPKKGAIEPVRHLDDVATPDQEAPRPTTAAVGTDEGEEIADLLRLVANPDDLPAVSAGQLRDGEFAFYSICIPQPTGEVITIVRAVSPTRSLRRAAFFGRFAGSLRRVERPDLQLEDSVDLVITGDEIAVMNRGNFDRLFSDLDAVALAVPGHVLAVQTAMPQLPFAPGTADTLTALCQRLPSLAKRLAALANSPALATLTPSALRDALASHGENSGHWLDQADSLTLTEERAKEFLDLVEGRWWTSDFSAERRRADRFRKR
jgi:hypothetical protein